MRTSDTRQVARKSVVKAVVSSKQKQHVLSTDSDVITIAEYGALWAKAKANGLVKSSYEQFLTALLETSWALTIPVPWLLRLFYFETGGRFRMSHKARNSVTGALGLFQLLPKYRYLVGQEKVSKENWGWANEASNCRDFLKYVDEKFSERSEVRPSAPFTNFVQLYLMNFWPAAYFGKFKPNTVFKSSSVSAATIANRNPKFDNGSSEVTTASVAEGIDNATPLFLNFTRIKVQEYLRQINFKIVDEAKVAQYLNEMATEDVDDTSGLATNRQAKVLQPVTSINKNSSW